MPCHVDDVSQNDKVIDMYKFIVFVHTHTTSTMTRNKRK